MSKVGKLCVYELWSYVHGILWWMTFPLFFIFCLLFGFSPQVQRAESAILVVTWSSLARQGQVLVVQTYLVPLISVLRSHWHVGVHPSGGGEVFCKTRIIALRASVLNFCVARCVACLDVSMLPCAHLGQSLWQSHNLPHRAPGVFYSLPKDSSETSNYPWLFACCFILTPERLIFLVCCKEQRQHQGLQGRGKKQSAG